MSSVTNSSPQGRYWFLTISCASNPWNPPDALPAGVTWIKGQQELGQGGLLHWQLLCSFSRSVRRRAVQRIYGPCFCELSRSSAAESYVWKDETAVANTRFELGSRPLNKGCKKDWSQILASAKVGDFSSIPPDVIVRNYSSLRRIEKDHMKPTAIVKRVFVFYGPTGTGKSRRAWEEATFDAYPKDPNTKYWDGYSGQKNVVIDEFRGKIDISHVLRWLDRYPVSVECKYGACVLRSESIWITSNLHPRAWYDSLDLETQLALERRFTDVVDFGRGNL